VQLLTTQFCDADEHEVPYFMQHPFDSLLIAIPFCFLVCFPYLIARKRECCNSSFIGSASLIGLALLPFSIWVAGSDRYDACQLACWWWPGILIWFTALICSYSDQTILQRRALQELLAQRILQFRQQMSRIGRKGSEPRPTAQNPIT